MDLHVFWFALLGVLLVGYAILDGFDLGVGILHLVARGDQERRLFMNSIGPLWDGNEVWLVTFGGALFAAFPRAYAAVFSAFYLPFMLLLFALIFRAVSMEFRGKREGATWRRWWDRAFFAASALATFLMGVAVGDAIFGLPLSPGGEFTGGIADLLRPYALAVGAFAVALFALHGSLYLWLKTGDELQARVRATSWRAFGAFLVAYMLVTIFTLVRVPSAVRNFTHAPWAWLVVVANVFAIANIPRALYHGKPLTAFASSAATIAALVFLFGVALYPNLLVSSADPATSLTIYTAASSPKTLRIMRWIALVGMPFVAAYTAVVYWVFRGKVQLGKASY
jgi:cytochrome d ubiquinol oxidase subunit II